MKVSGFNFEPLRFPTQCPRLLSSETWESRVPPRFIFSNHKFIKKKVQVILHAGDFAYDIKTDEGKRADDLMNMIEAVASKVAYQVILGNHESGNGKYTQ